MIEHRKGQGDTLFVEPFERAVSAARIFVGTCAFPVLEGERQFEQQIKRVFLLRCLLQRRRRHHQLLLSGPSSQLWVVRGQPSPSFLSGVVCTATPSLRTRWAPRGRGGSAVHNSPKVLEDVWKFHMEGRVDGDGEGRLELRGSRGVGKSDVLCCKVRGGNEVRFEDGESAVLEPSVDPEKG